MMEKEERRRALGRLFDELADAASADEEAARETLREAGKDPEQVRARSRKFIERMQGKARRARAELKKRKVDRLQKRFKERLSNRPDGDPKEILAGVLSSETGQGAQFHFRKIEELSDGDAADMIGEMELLRLIEESEKNNEGNGAGDPK